MSSAVRIVEVGPRDGLQNIARRVPTAIKVALIQRLLAAGLTTVEATSFVSPKWIPQLADNKDVLRALTPLLQDNDDDNASIRLPVLVPNLIGLNDALRHGAREVAVFVSASEGFSRRNTNCSVNEALERARVVVTKARECGVAVRGYVSCIFTCPYDGPTPPASVHHVTESLLAMGCYEVSLGDTLGTGTPTDVETLLATLLSSSSSSSITADQLAGHFHDTHGNALRNVLAAHAMGLRTFDSSVAGLGGCPYAPGARGNVATEDVVAAFAARGVSTGGVDLRKVREVGVWISEVLEMQIGRRLLVAEEGAKGPAATAVSPTTTSTSGGWAPAILRSPRVIGKELTGTFRSLSSQSTA